MCLLEGEDGKSLGHVAHAHAGYLLAVVSGARTVLPLPASFPPSSESNCDRQTRHLGMDVDRDSGRRPRPGGMRETVT